MTKGQESQAAHWCAIVEHNDTVRRLLDGTTPQVRAFIRRRDYRLDLYPLDFVQKFIADCEAFEREVVAHASAADAPPRERKE